VIQCNIISIFSYEILRVNCVMKYGIALNAKYHQISNLCFRGM
jgi:hypothetical protein